MPSYGVFAPLFYSFALNKGAMSVDLPSHFFVSYAADDFTKSTVDLIESK